MKHDNDSGQSLIELALTLPLLMLLLLGAVELGQLAYGAINVSNAAKSATQYGAQMAGTMVDTQGILAAAQDEIAIPGQVGSLDMPMPVAMPDGSALPASDKLDCNPTNGSYACSYCTCSNPDVAHLTTPFNCATAVVTGVNPTCTNNSHLEQNLIITTHVVVQPILHLPGLPATFNMYGHAVVKRLQ